MELDREDHNVVASGGRKISNVVGTPATWLGLDQENSNIDASCVTRVNNIEGTCSNDNNVIASGVRRIKGPDNPTSQLLPKMSFNGFSRDREGRKDKGGGEKSRR